MGILKDAGFEDGSVVTWTERTVDYRYMTEEGPVVSHTYTGVHTWEELEEFIRDEVRGNTYEITKKQERTVTMTDWKDVD